MLPASLPFFSFSFSFFMRSFPHFGLTKVSPMSRIEYQKLYNNIEDITYGFQFLSPICLLCLSLRNELEDKKKKKKQSTTTTTTKLQKITTKTKSIENSFVSFAFVLLCWK